MRRILRIFKHCWRSVHLLFILDKNNPEALSQLYKMMNYKPASNKGEKLTTEQVASFLSVGKKNSSESYDDIMNYDDAKIKVKNIYKLQ